jgi:hypothetical protein
MTKVRAAVFGVGLVITMAVMQTPVSALFGLPITLDVFDFGLFVKNEFMNTIQKEILTVTTEHERQIYRSARRIMTILGVAPSYWLVEGMPLWRTRRVDPALPETIAMMDAYNGAGRAESGFEATTLPRLNADAVFARLGEEDTDASARLHADLAELEATEAAAIAGIAQSGLARGNRKNGRGILADLAKELVKTTGSTNDVLDTGSAMATYRMRQGETGVALARSLMQQFTAQTLADRNRDVARWNRRILAESMRSPDTPTLLDDATRAIETWRQP